MRNESPKAEGLNPKLQTLAAGGVVMLSAATVFAEESVDPTRIAPGVVIHPGCRIRGRETSIGPDCVLGEEAPVTLDNCQLERNVCLKGGYFSGATLLAGASFGSAAHVRPGTIMEEHSSCAHAVGLKQTVLMPYVALGSLINFCDCLMAGGASRKDHSEVGSSFVHFNYTAHRDKATPSLFGDVPRGVMLNQAPIFLGGQGGIVGPVRIEYGTITAAGTVYRRDVTRPGRLVFGQFARTSADIPYDLEIFGDIRRLLTNNFIYIGNLHALSQWYRQVRARFLSRDAWGQACLDGALQRLRELVGERIARLEELAGKMRISIESAGRKHGHNLAQGPYALQQSFADRWPDLAPKLELDAQPAGDAASRDRFLVELDRLSVGSAYFDAIRRLSPAARESGVVWLQSIVDAIAGVRDF